MEADVVDYDDGVDALICRFSGRIDTNAALSIEDALLDKVQRAGKPVVFDFDGLEYVASSFLRLCVKVVRMMGSERLKVVGSSEEIRRIFEMTGFSKLMDMEPVEGD